MSATAALVRTVADFIAQQRLFGPKDRLLLAASGGKDSTTLFHVLVELGYAVDLAHCNYGLRGADSDADEAFVRNMAKQLGVRCHVVRIGLDPATDSIQLVAREKRYIYFEKILDEYSYDYLITAHHLHDNLESTLINFLRGSGLTGLRGIPPQRGRIVRPLLSASPSLIEGYALERGLSWREDASNESDDYLRNRIRHRLLPVLQDLGLRDSTLARTLDRLRAENLILDQGYAGWAANVRYTERGMVIDRAPLTDEPQPVQLRLLTHFTAGQHWTPEQYRQMLTVAATRTLQTSTHRVDITPLSFTFSALPAVTSLPDILIDALPFRCAVGDWEYSVAVVPRPASFLAPGVLYLRHPEGSSGGTGPPISYHLRPRRKGDAMAILGLNGRRKKVKKILRELGLSAADREQLYLLTDDADDVLAVVGHGIIAERAAVGPGDRLVVRVSRTRKSPGTP